MRSTSSTRPVTPPNQTGYTAPGLRLRAEAGSYGYQKQSVSIGGVEGNFDYYLNADNYRNDGYRDYSLSKSQGTTAATSGAGSRRPGSVWVGSKTTYTFDDDSKLTFGASYYEYAHNNSPNSPANPSYWDWHDLSFVLGYDRTDKLFGHESRTNLAFTSTEHLKGEVNSTFANKQTRKFVDYGSSFDHVFSFGNDLELVDNLWLTSGLSAINVRRHADVKQALQANTTTYPTDVTYDNWSLAPRIGVRYEFTPQLQVFANVSRSIDPPASWEYSGSGPTTPYVRPLVEQKANTVEIGVKGASGIFDGSLALYRSWVRDELLNVQIGRASD